MIISKYVKIFPLKNGYEAYYHSLRMKPVFVSFSESQELQEAIANNRIPRISKNTLQSLKNYMILVESEEKDNKIIDFVRNFVPLPYISLAYFVLTEKCNLACKYCFLGNSDISAHKVTDYPMSRETADKAIAFFAKQTQQDMNQFYDEKEIIFYGGEPLINFDIIKYVIERCKYYQNKNLISKKLSFSMVTNGILLTDEIAIFLKEHNIGLSISIDGADVECNSERVNHSGEVVFQKIIEKIKLANRIGLRYGLSVTLTDNTIVDLDKFILFLDEYNIKSVCFNILFKSKNISKDENYYNKATEFIINFYKKTRDKYIYEDRMHRKLQAFVDSELYFSDCAATSGSQIVITPDGEVGICHGLMEDRKYFVGNINNPNLIIQKLNVLKKWCHFSPVFKKECQQCEALGICGGGCPHNVINEENDQLESVDHAFCIHSKKILKFLIEELFSKMPIINQCETYDETITVKCRKRLQKNINDKINKTIVVIGLNPSKSDDYIDDKTTRFLKIRFSKEYGKLIIYNLYQGYSTKSSFIVRDTRTNFWDDDIQKDFYNADAILLAWGIADDFENEAEAALLALKKHKNKLICFKKENDIVPRPLHPLYLTNNCKVWKYTNDILE